MDFFLQPEVIKIKSYLKDTTHLLKIIENLGSIQKDCLLFSLDVKSLYTVLPNKEGIQACSNALNASRIGPQKPTNKSITHLLTYFLTMNNFVFNGKHYLQVGGTAMGTRLAPSYANMFMSYFEDTHVYSYHTQPLIWVRYIDDIFGIWQHSSESLNLFITHLNTCHESIKFTSCISDTSIDFLDCTLLLNNNGTKSTPLSEYSIRTSLNPRPTAISKLSLEFHTHIS